MTAKSTLSEADLCARFIVAATKPGRAGRPRWVAYAETAGFDILLVRDGDGVQIGIEAKLALNPRVVAQALPYREGWSGGTQAGPDYRAVLVPASKVNADVKRICAALGLTVIEHRGERGGEFYGPNAYGPEFTPDLPCENAGRFLGGDWHEWAPAERCAVPEYVPDVQAGCSAPIALTAWKVKAIRLSILLEDRPVTRADFKALQLSPTNWLCPRGWLDPVPGARPGAWVRCDRTPNFEQQHPTNYGQIKADKDRWAPSAPRPVAIQGALL